MRSTATSALSETQLRFLFLDRLYPGTPINNCALHLRTGDAIDVERLAHAANWVIGAHPMLHSPLPLPSAPLLADERDPSQPCGPPPIAVSECSAPTSEAVAELRRAVENRPFDLADGQHVRIAVIREPSDTTMLVVTSHRAVLGEDGLRAFVEQLAAAYSRSSGCEDTVPANARTGRFDEFRRSHDAWSSRRRERLEELWRNWPIDRPLVVASSRPRPTLLGWACESVELPGEVPRGAVAAAADRFATSDEAVLLAAWMLVLSVYGRTSSISIGVPAPFSDGDLSSAGVVGPFDQFLVVRSAIDRTDSFERIAEMVETALARAKQSAGLEYAALVRLVGAPPELSYTPIFQSTFRTLDPVEISFGSDTRATLLSLPVSVGRFDTNLVIVRSGEQLSGRIDYLADAIDRDSAARLATHYIETLDQLIDPEAAELSERSVLTAEEHAAERGTRTRMSGASRRAVALHQLIDEQVAVDPQRPAVVFGEQTLSYGELGARAQRLASYLIERGIQPGDVVGVHVERGIELLPALVGTMKAGAAYLPLPPGHPAARLQTIHDDAEAAAVLCGDADRDRQPPLSGASLLYLAEAGDLDERAAEAFPTPAAEQLAYVMYTSGSTGQPKGVEVEHGAAVNAILEAEARLGVGDGDVTVSVSPFFFDLSVLDFFTPLCLGGTVILADADQRSDGVLLGRLLDRVGATVSIATPSTYRLLLQADWPGSERIALLSCGEELPVEVARGLLNRCRALFNLYGPTEATVYCTAFQVTRASIAGASRVPIGAPIADCAIHLLDETRRPVPIGVPGRLFIAGGCLARGYRRRPELTRERFPEGLCGEARLYDTGDLARRRADGNLEFIGRADDQIKLRGYRIEPDEVSKTLEQHAAVGQCTVVLHSAGTQRAGLAAVCVPEGRPGSPEALRSELQRFAAERLPGYMRPTAFLFLDEMPLTAQGKIDRARLAERLAETSPVRQPRTGAEPLGDVEARLVQIWETLLDRSPIGVTDDFFALGGHSLLGMRLMVEIERAFSVKLPLSALFPVPTVRSLAQRLREPERIGGVAAGSCSLVPIRLGARGGPQFFCVHPISGQTSMFRPLAAELPPDWSFYGFETTRDFAHDERCSIRETAEQYAALLQRIDPSGPYVIGGLSAGCTIAFEMAGLLGRRGSEVTLLVLVDLAPPVKTFIPDRRELSLMTFAGANLLGFGAGGFLKGCTKAIMVDKLEAMDPAERFPAWIAHLRRHGVFSVDIPDKEILQIFRTTMANLDAYWSYVLEAPIEAPIAFVRNTSPTNMPYAFWGSDNADGVDGWSRWSRAGVLGPWLVPDSDHWTLLGDPRVARRLGQTLREILVGHSAR